MATYSVCCLPGDGIGPEIMAASRVVLDAVADRFGFEVACAEHLIGGAAIDACGCALPDETLEAARAADSVLLASVGGPKWDTTDPAAPRPEQGLLAIRKALGLYCNLRPVHVFDALVGASSLKPELVRGVDMLIVRELTGGLYFGARAHRRRARCRRGRRARRVVLGRSGVRRGRDRARGSLRL